MSSISEDRRSELWMQAVVETSNHYYLLKKKHGEFPVTGDMIMLETDRRFARLCRWERDTLQKH